MSVTEETFQPEISELKAGVTRNISLMSVTEETSQPEISELNESACQNMPDMSVTEETSQSEKSPSKESANQNIPDMSVTDERSGVSVARYSMFLALVNARYMDSHCISPHCSMDCSLDALDVFVLR